MVATKEVAVEKDQPDVWGIELHDVHSKPIVLRLTDIESIDAAGLATRIIMSSGTPHYVQEEYNEVLNRLFSIMVK